MDEFGRRLEFGEVMPSDDYEALLRAVLDAPDDDTPRLVLADWLDDHDQPLRATFIRVQVQLARTPRWVGECKVCGATPDDEGDINHVQGCSTQSEDGGESEFAEENPEWRDLSDLQEAMLAENSRQWTAGVLPSGNSSQVEIDVFGGRQRNMPRPSGAIEIITYEFRRGFIDNLVCEPEQWLQWADALTSTHPIRGVHLMHWPDGYIPRVLQARNWKSPPVEGGHPLDCWRAEWPTIQFSLPGGAN